MTEHFDSIVVGAGHNGLVAATLLARAGRSVLILEERESLGGAVRSEYPFKRVPQLATSTGAYLLGLMPPELIEKLGLELPLIRRDPHYFLPGLDDRYLLFGSDTAAVRQQCLSFFSAADWEAHCALQAELAALRDDLAATWLQAPLSIEQTAERFVRAELRDHFIRLCRGSVGEYLERFGFESELLMAMYAVTDGFSGLSGGWDSPGSGMNFLIHNMCRLPGSDGTWMLVKGGMGEISRQLAAAAKAAGAQLRCTAAVREIEVTQGSVTGVRLDSGERFRAQTVVCGCDPFTMASLIDLDALPESYLKRLSELERPGMTFKLNFALRALPTFRCLPEDRGQHRGTIHLLPQENVIDGLRTAFAQASAGQLPDFPTIEWYIHTTLDASLQDPQGHHNSALFVQWVPNELAEGTWDAALDGFCAQLFSICDRFAPGTSDLVVDRFPLHPQKIESHFGIHQGHIHHVDNSFGFDERHPYRLPIAGLYSASAGCHPAGSVIGCAGHNAAMAVLEDVS